MYAQQPTPAAMDPRKKRPEFQSTKGNKPSVDGGPVNDVAAGNAQSEAPIPYPLPAIGSKPITPPSPGPVPGPAITPNGGGRRQPNPEAIAARQAFMSKWRADNQPRGGGGMQAPPNGGGVQGTISAMPMPYQVPPRSGMKPPQQGGQEPWVADGGRIKFGQGDPKGGGGQFDRGNPEGSGGKPRLKNPNGSGIIDNWTQQPMLQNPAFNPGSQGGVGGGMRAMPMPSIGGGIQAFPQPTHGQIPMGPNGQPDYASMYNNVGGDMSQLPQTQGGQQDPRLAYFNMMSGQQ